MMKQREVHKGSGNSTKVIWCSWVQDLDFLWWVVLVWMDLNVLPEERDSKICGRSEKGKLVCLIMFSEEKKCIPRIKPLIKSTGIPLKTFVVKMQLLFFYVCKCKYPWFFAAGLWTLHAEKGQNIQLHFLDFDVEATYDVVEVRDGAGLNSTLLGEKVFSTAAFGDRCHFK